MDNFSFHIPYGNDSNILGGKGSIFRRDQSTFIGNRWYIIRSYFVDVI